MHHASIEVKESTDLGNLKIWPHSKGGDTNMARILRIL